MASRIAAMSASTAPPVQAAYTDNIVVSRWPCSLATNSGLRPIIRFQLTEVWRAMYGLRYRMARQRRVRCQRKYGYRTSGIGAPQSVKKRC